MAKSAFVLALDQIQQSCAVQLKQVGFRKRGRSHNRTCDDGLVHVVTFQMGQYPIGDYEVPGFRESFYGRFAVNLGVRVPCVPLLEFGLGEKSFYQEYDCQIRRRLGTDTDEGESWWRLDQPADPVAREVSVLLATQAAEFFSDFRSCATVLAYFQRHGEFPFSNSGRSAFEAALIQHHLGSMKDAERLFAVAMRWNHQGFREHVSEVRQRCGYSA